MPDLRFPRRRSVAGGLLLRPVVSWLRTRGGDCGGAGLLASAREQRDRRRRVRWQGGPAGTVAATAARFRR